MKFDILGLLPPTNADAAHDRWQRAITAAVLIIIAMLISSNAVLGAALYQAQKDQASIVQKLDALAFDQKVGNLFTRIMMMRMRYCDAYLLGWDDQRKSWDEQIIAALAEYQALTRQPFPMFNPC